MHYADLSINGSETKVANTELAALSTFYRAFNNRDLALMEQSWLNTDETSMDNPIGGIRRGWTEIRGGYERIFLGKAAVYVEFYDFSVHQTGAMFFATGRERGWFKADGIQFDLAIRTTRIFVKWNGEWRQIHHHGSIENPELLEMYQKAVLKK